MKSKRFALSMLLTFIISTTSVMAQAQNTSLHATSSTWADAELNKAKEYGLIPTSLIGKDMTKHITREEFAEVAVKLYEKALNVTASFNPINPFTDTKNVEILKAYKLGITAGTTSTTFSPNTVTNREQVATMFSNTIRIIAPKYDFSTVGAPVFTDAKDISSWAVVHVKFMSKIGIIKGADGKFMPRPITPSQKASDYAITTREQAISMSVRIYEKFALDKGTESPVSTNLIGNWEYYFNAYTNGQYVKKLELKKDGTFTYIMAMVVSSGSSLTSSTYGVATSSQGKYKITADNKLCMYNITGTRYEETVNFDNLYKMIEKTYDMPIIIVEDREFIYKVEDLAGDKTLTLKPVLEEIDKLGFGMLTADDPFTLSK